LSSAACHNKSQCRHHQKADFAASHDPHRMSLTFKALPGGFVDSPTSYTKGIRFSASQIPGSHVYGQFATVAESLNQNRPRTKTEGSECCRRFGQ
jgi:hypothetical protein